MAAALPSSPPAVVSRAREKQDREIIGGAALPTVEPCAEFWLAAHPSRWLLHESDGKSYLLPGWRKLVLRPGVNGVPDKVDKPEIRAVAKEAYFAQVRAKGWQPVPWSAAPAGRSSYLLEVDCAPTPEQVGVRHICFYESVFPGDGTIECDVDALNEWVKQLVANGVISAPAAQHVRATMRELEAKAIRAEAAAAAGNANQATAAAVLRRQIEACQAWLPAKPQKKPERPAPSAGRAKEEAQ